MTTLKLMAAALGISLAAITALPQTAAAERVDREQRIYQSNPYYGGTARSQQFRHDRRATVYAVPFDRFQRYVKRHGRHDLNSQRFRKWAVQNGRPVRHPINTYSNSRPRDNGQNRWQNWQQNGWWNNRDDSRRKRWQPQWVYVDLRSGRYWF